jgi:hypothetical protein
LLAGKRSVNGKTTFKTGIEASRVTGRTFDVHHVADDRGSWCGSQATVMVSAFADDGNAKRAHDGRNGSNRRRRTETPHILVVISRRPDRMAEPLAKYRPEIAFA